MDLGKRLGYASMPVRWLWRGCWDWDAVKVALCFAMLGRAPTMKRRTPKGP